jgi:hypothetical protein
MPYIKPENRKNFDNSAITIANNAKNVGDLNYAITVIVQSYIKKKSLCYANLNEIHGMLDCCNKELYRKITAKYEEACIIKNGDVNLLQKELQDAAFTPKTYEWTNTEYNNEEMNYNVVKSLSVICHTALNDLINRTQDLNCEHFLICNQKISNFLSKYLVLPNKLNKFEIIINEKLENEIHIQIKTSTFKTFYNIIKLNKMENKNADI